MEMETGTQLSKTKSRTAPPPWKDSEPLADSSRKTNQRILKAWFSPGLQQLKRYQSVFILILAILAVGALTDGAFFSPRNLTNLSKQVCINGILSLGMTFIILTGGIDLSVGSVAAVSGIAAALLQVNLGFSAQGYMGAFLSLGAAIFAGMLSGLLSGFIIVKSRVVPFIITLGLMVTARGLALILSKGAAISPLSEEFNYFGQGYIEKTPSLILLGALLFLSLWKILSQSKNWIHAACALLGFACFAYAFGGYRGLPVPVLLFGSLAAAAHYFLQHTVWGRYVIATGSNPNAAFLSGVPVNKIIFFVYLLMGTLAGLSGGILSARLNGAMPTAGDLFELDAIAAVVIGGTKLTGGVGTIGGSVIGAFLMGIINNGMSLLNVDEFYQKVIKGIIIVTAVWAGQRSTRKH